jgi:acyl-CoA thioesterase-1
MAAPAKGLPDVSFMFLVDLCLSPRSGEASYGRRQGLLQTFRMAAAAAACATVVLAPGVAAVAAPTTVHVVALGDSLTAGYGLPEGQGFAPRLQAALNAQGVPAQIEDAGVSGNTAADGLARLDWSVPQGTDAVVLELGANDMLRGLDPRITYKALDEILRRLAERHIAVLLCGMRAAPNLGAEYVASFERLYTDLAKKYDVLLYPFFLDGAAADQSLNQRDGLHPNAAGVEVIVRRILPKVKELIAQARAQHPS